MGLSQVGFQQRPPLQILKAPVKCLRCLQLQSAPNRIAPRTVAAAGKASHAAPLERLEKPKQAKVAPPEEVSAESAASEPEAEVKPTGPVGDMGPTTPRTKKDITPYGTLKTWNKIRKHWEKGTVLEGKIVEALPGGVQVTIEGRKGFLPYSYMSAKNAPIITDDNSTRDLSGLIGKTIKFKVLEMSRSRNRLILSEQLLLPKRDANSPPILKANPPPVRPTQPEAEPTDVGPQTAGVDWAAVAKLAADSTLCRARVTNVLDTGVQLSAFEGIGFIPAGLMDPTRFAKIDASPEERAKLTAKLNGTEIVFKVVEFDQERSRIILSERLAVQAKVAKSLKVGWQVDGVVTRLLDFGALVGVLDKKDGLFHGAEGLVHISELSWGQVMKPEEIVSVGQKVRCVVTGVDLGKGRIKLSMKQVEKDPLLENMDTVLTEPNTEGEQTPVALPDSLRAICAELLKEEGIDGVALGRRGEEKRAVSQDLEMWMLKEKVTGEGFNLAARAGRIVQEIQVTTTLTSDEMKESVQRVLKRLI